MNDHYEIPDEIDFKHYYNPMIILNKRDLDDEIPCHYFVSGNRSSGKTTGFLLIQLALYHKYGCQALLIYRYEYELASANEIYHDCLSLYPDYGKEMKTKAMAKGMFYELQLDGEVFGYAVALSSVDNLRKYSPVFAKTYFAIFDEFQLESGRYLSREVSKLQSLLVTVSRGGGHTSRPMRIVYLSNAVTLMNPYFISFGIYKRYQSETKFLRGNGYIAEFNYNQKAAEAIQENRLLTPFIGSTYNNYATSAQYLGSDKVFVDKLRGRSKYMFTIEYDGIRFGVHEAYSDGFIYIDHKYNPDVKTVLAFRSEDHTQNTIMLGRYSYIWKTIRDAYNMGALRFDDLQTKNAVLDILAVDLAV